MSEEGWKAFLHADGVDDWVVLHGGAVAVFPVGSITDAAALAAAISAVPGLDASGALMTVGDDRLTVRLTRDLWMLESEHADLARAVSAVARERGVAADRSAVREVQLTISAKPDDIDLGFWRAVLGYDPMSPDNGVDPLGNSTTVWMQELDPAKPLRHAMHIDVSVAREHAEERVAAALAAGGRIVDESEAPAAWILADPAGNKVCIAAWPDGAMPPDRSILAGDYRPGVNRHVRYSRLVEALRLCALPYADQAGALPEFVFVPDEVVEAFDDAYRALTRWDTTFRSPGVRRSLRELDALFTEMSEVHDRESVWSVEAMQVDPRWELVRSSAVGLLAMLHEPLRRPVFPGYTWVGENAAGEVVAIRGDEVPVEGQALGSDDGGPGDPPDPRA